LTKSSLSRIARQRHRPLDEVPLRVHRILEDEDVSAPYLAIGQEPRQEPAAVRGEDELVDEQTVAHEKGPLHGGRGDLEGLDQKGPDEQSEDDRDAGGLEEVRRKGPEIGPRRFYRTIRNIRSHRVRVKKWMATPRSCRTLSTAPRQMCALGSAS
jgi:hypothetical protein